MGTTYSVKVITEGLNPVKGADELQKQIDARLKDINQVMSTYIPDSEISLLNKASQTEVMSVSSELLDIILTSQKISEDTAGAFDISVGPLVNLWGFGPEELEQKLPSDAAVAAVMQRVGYHKLAIDKTASTLQKQADLYLDLSAIAKGYGVDEIAELLEAENFHNFMVEIGGEIRIKGRNPQRKPWTIGVENPSLFKSGHRQAVASEDAAIATSGDYRNYREVEGKRFSHTIDPVSGKPITHNLTSVTVITHSAALADAYATAINVLGPEKGLAFAEEHQLAAFFILRKDHLY